MEVKIPEQLYKPLKKVIRLQNVELLKLISFEEGWDFKELKKKYIKDTEVYELVKKYDKKQKKKFKKINKQKILNSNSNVLEESNSVEQVEFVKEPILKVVDKKEKIPKKKKINKKISVKSSKNELIEITCKEFLYEDIKLYYDINNFNVFTEELEFVGRKMSNFIDFDAIQI